MNEHVAANRRLWDSWTPYNVASAFYDVEGFKAGRRGRTALDDLEIALVGDVAGRSLLHLQCHFGKDTIAWAQRGAVVTGVDFSPVAIAAARKLAAEMGVPATFVESDVYAVPHDLDGRFDIVFTSHGVLGWLPDLEGWAQVVARCLAPGGRFCVIEAHPFLMTIDEHRADRELRVTYPYFHGSEPIREEHRGCYAEPDAPIDSVEHVWVHPLSSIMGSLLRAGLRLDSFAEYPFMGWKFIPWMEQRADGTWELPGAPLPLMFSLTATKAH